MGSAIAMARVAQSRMPFKILRNMALSRASMYSTSYPTHRLWCNLVIMARLKAPPMAPMQAWPSRQAASCKSSKEARPTRFSGAYSTWCHARGQRRCCVVSRQPMSSWRAQLAATRSRNPRTSCRFAGARDLAISAPRAGLASPPRSRRTAPIWSAAV